MMMSALDPQSNQQEQAAVVAEKQPEDLPETAPFPYARVHFDPFFFGVNKEPPKVERAAD